MTLLFIRWHWNLTLSFQSCCLAIVFPHAGQMFPARWHARAGLVTMFGGTTLGVSLLPRQGDVQSMEENTRYGECFFGAWVHGLGRE